MSTSLVEWKKQQWARERAEMENMNNPWGLPPPAYRLKHEFSRSRYSSSLEIRETCPVTTQQNLLPRRQRSPSLPPILRFEDEGKHKQDIVVKRGGKPEDGGETSGYASDNAPHSSPNVWQNSPRRNRSGSNEYHSNSSERHQIGKLGSSTESEGRPRWGDKGVAVGRLWEPQDPDCRLPQMQTKSTPRWVERGLSMIDSGESQVLVINHNDGNQSPDHKNMRDTFLLGQSAPLEPSIKAEREVKRLKALELQAAIMQQLEDREKQKKEEKQRRIREEIEEEERFKRQKELERQRLEEERRTAEEKRYKEQKRSEALRLALEKAELDAKQDRESRKMKKLRQNFDTMSVRSDDIEDEDYRSRNLRTNPNANESKLMKNIFSDQAYSPRSNNNVNAFSHPNNTQRDSAVVLPNQYASEKIDHVPGETRYNEEIKSVAAGDKNPPVFYSPSSMSTSVSDVPLSLVQMPISTEMFTPMHVTHSSGMQMAFLMPQQIYPCVHQPIGMQAYYTETHQRNIMQVHPSSEHFNATRVLTPTKYRSGYYRDAITQTDITSESLQKIISSGIGEAETETLETNEIDSKENMNDHKKEKKYSEDKVNSGVERRPKWGVNKPPTQYKKQSEKDIFYPHKRKLKQRKRTQEKTYTSHSSDENKSPSPVRNDTQNFLNVWGKRNQKYVNSNQNNNNYITETAQTEFSKHEITNTINNSQEQKKTFTEKKIIMPKRGMTLSQKFINDKYGHPQICSPEIDSHNNSLGKIDYHMKINDEIQRSNGKDRNDHRKQHFDKNNKIKKDNSTYTENKEDSEPILLDQLRFLKDNLKRQQKIWGTYEVKNNRKSPSPNNELDLEYE